MTISQSVIYGSLTIDESAIRDRRIAIRRSSDPRFGDVQFTAQFVLTAIRDRRISITIDESAIRDRRIAIRRSSDPRFGDVQFNVKFVLMAIRDRWICNPKSTDLNYDRWIRNP